MAEFSIRQHYRMMYDEPIDLGAVQSLTKVYLPIIGRDAFTLYLAWAMMGETPDAQNLHVDLLDQLAISQHDFLSARQNLEGMGLIKTYRQDTSFGSQWVYRLFPPMTMKAFWLIPCYQVYLRIIWVMNCSNNWLMTLSQRTRQFRV